MARRTTQLAYQAIRIEGGLIPADELARLTSLQDPDRTEQTETHYGIPKGLKLRDEIARYWKIALNLWADFNPQRQRTDLDAHDLTLREFLLPLLRNALGYADLKTNAVIEASGHAYNIGHLSGDGRVPLILAAHGQDLDAPADRFGETNPETGKVRRRSPFMLAQEALNASDASLWAIVSNGLRLRILRDNPSLTRPVYVEVDLEAIFNEELYADFVAFWLLAHASRFAMLQAGGEAKPSGPADCPWERWRNAGQEAGVRARDRLRVGVADALRALGSGFLSHRDNNALREALQQEDGLTRQAFFEELLGLVYRFIFLATVEDRTDVTTGQPLIFTPDSPDDARQRYLAGYSLTWLRERAVRRSSFDTHSDLWQALTITFDALARGESALGLPALGGLFDREQCPHLDVAQIENRWLLEAVFHLGYFREPTGLTRVNYRDMGPEELGSVYESLLELVPDPQNLAQPHAARLAFVGDDDASASTKGNTRKLTGSYYTPDPLVQELIKSALEPVIAETVKANPQQPVEALLQLTICDPACGSGHFLLAAARRLADEVAKLRAPGGAPSQADYRHALRDVVSRCIFGVDKNPMAIALAKTALWLEAYTPDRPLSFLDHHLQVGDALLGVLDPKVLENGIPDEAYAALSGDDKETASALKKQNKADLKSWKAIAAGDLFAKSELVTQADAVEHLADDSLAGIAAKRAAWAQAKGAAKRSTLARLADTYVAAFLAPKLPQNAHRIPLSGYLWGLINNEQSRPELDAAAHEICREHGVFHWWLAFPQVRARGGFSVMLGNPPWDMLQLDPQEFFSVEAPSIANAQHMTARNRMIAALERERPYLFKCYWQAVRATEAVQAFVHASGRFPHSGFGRINLASLFAETVLQATALQQQGRAGLVLPSGIATDSFTQHLFNEIARRGLASLYDFENREGIFPGVHRSYKFCLLTLAKTEVAQFQFFAGNPSHLSDANRRFTLSSTDFELLNPNTRTCSVFRSKADAELTKKIYRSTPVLWREAELDGDGNVVRAEDNPWNLRLQLMFMMSSDSYLFAEQVADGATGSQRLPLYEAKMIHQFDHRWATYINATGKPGGVDTADVSLAQKADPGFVVRPRYWVDEREVLARIARVPARVGSTWLALHKASTRDRAEAEQKLQFAVASWVAGELFRSAVGEPENEGDWSSKQRLQGTKAAELGLDKAFPDFAAALKAANISGKKALAEFAKWALQDAEVGLYEAELEALSGEISDSVTLLGFLDGLMEGRSPTWLMGWRDICRSTDERTLIASVVPRAAVGNTMPLFYSDESPALQAALLGNWCSLIFDYVVRQKIGGTHLTYGYVKQFPVLLPDRYTEADLAFIVPRVLELTYTAHDLKPWADDLAAYDPRPAGERGTPFAWNPERRAQLRAELDAYYARLYGLTRDELRYILDPADVMGDDYPSETFRVLKNNEMREFGEYRTRRLVLEAWDALEAGTMVPMQVPLQDHERTVVYSEQGLVRNAEEAELAGLVAALVKRSVSGMSRAQLEEAVADAVRPELLAAGLDMSAATQLRDQAKRLPALTQPGAVEAVARFVQRLEGAGAIQRQRRGEVTYFVSGARAVPADVSASPTLDALADGLIAAAERRGGGNAGESADDAQSSGDRKML